jgi:hypothetical protein
MITIYKYPAAFDDRFVISMPRDANILSAQIVPGFAGQVVLWARVLTLQAPAPQIGGLPAEPLAAEKAAPK